MCTSRGMLLVQCLRFLRSGIRKINPTINYDVIIQRLMGVQDERGSQVLSGAVVPHLGVTMVRPCTYQGDSYLSYVSVALISDKHRRHVHSTLIGLVRQLTPDPRPPLATQLPSCLSRWYPSS